MKLPIRVTPEAYADVVEHAAYLEQLNPTVPLRFIRAALKTYDFLAEFPSIGTLYELDDPAIPALRRWPVRGFPKYLIFYRDEGNVLEIVRVIHATRDIPPMLRRT